MGCCEESVLTRCLCDVLQIAPAPHEHDFCEAPVLTWCLGDVPVLLVKDLDFHPWTGGSATQERGMLPRHIHYRE